MAVEITDARETGQYEARVDGRDEPAGIAQYLRTARVIAFIHTEVDLAYEGQGIGGALVRQSLDEARASGLKVLAACPFYAGWIAKHPDYQDLLHVSDSSVSD
jgi:predicted GNAT family acetyltransferase